MRKNENLVKRLAGLPVPEPDAAARSRALSRALTALEHREIVALPGRVHSGWRLFWPVGCTAALFCLLFVFAARWFETPGEGLADLKVLDEMAALFDERFEAVVEQGGEMDILLSPGEMPVPLSQQPVRIVMSRGRDVIRVLSFSGREVCLSLDGEETCLDILATKEGGVIITGGNFIWNAGNRVPLAGYRIEAAVLDPSS